jgi:predicted XRE-type DNA-binding protein
MFIAKHGKQLNNLCMDETVSRVQQLIDEKSLKWADIARRLKVSDQRVYNWRKRGIPDSQIVKIAAILDSSTDWLLAGKGPKNNWLDHDAGDQSLLTPSTMPQDNPSVEELEKENPFSPAGLFMLARKLNILC